MQTAILSTSLADPMVHVPDWVRFHARHRPDAVALHSADDGRQLTYRDLDRRIDALADLVTVVTTSTPLSKSCSDFASRISKE